MSYAAFCHKGGYLLWQFHQTLPKYSTAVLHCFFDVPPTQLGPPWPPKLVRIFYLARLPCAKSAPLTSFCEQ